MKRRLLAFALATSMVITSFNVAFAEETASIDQSIVAEETGLPSISDDVESGAGVEENSEATTEAIEEDASEETTSEPIAVSTANAELTSYTKNEVGNWKASVTGDVGSKDRISATETAPLRLIPNGKNEMVPSFSIVGDEKSVNMRAGMPLEPDGSGKVDKQGKIASTSSGFAYYYQELKADDDFIMSGTATINGIDNGDSQVAFGIMVRDDLRVDTYYNSSEPQGDEIVAGRLRIQDTGATMSNGWYRVGGSLISTTGETGDKSLISSSDVKPKGPTIETDEGGNTKNVPGTVHDIKMTKIGSFFTLTVDGESVTIDADEVGLNFTDDLFAGFAVSRCADITWTNMKLRVYGETPDLSAGWSFGANGNSKTSDFILTGDIENGFTMEADGTSKGKISDKEDSYGYYAIEIPDDEDFKISADVKVSYRGESTGINIQQAGAGIVFFDEQYVKENESKGVTGKHVMVALNPTTKDDVSSSVSAILRGRFENDQTTAPNVTSIIKSGVTSVNKTSDIINLSMRRSGDIITVAVDGIQQTINVGDIKFVDSGYLGFFVARNGKMEVSNVKLEAGSKSVDKINVISMPKQTTYYCTEPFNPEGLELEVLYKDGTSEVITNTDELTVTGFEGPNKSFNTPGSKKITLILSNGNVEMDINVRAMNVAEMTIDYAPVKTEYFPGTRISLDGIQVTAKYENGQTRVLPIKDMIFKLNDKEIDPSYLFVSDDAGEKDINIYHTDADPSINNAGAFASYGVSVLPGRLDGIEIHIRNFKTAYYVGDELDTSGMVINAVYINDQGREVTHMLKSDEYMVTGFNSSVSVREQVLTIVYKANPNFTTTYTISIDQPKVTDSNIDVYPRLTYNVGELFDNKGLNLLLLYNNGLQESVTGSVEYVKDGNEYFTITDGKYSPSDEATVRAADYYIDLTDFDSSKEGTTSVTVVFNPEHKLVDIKLPVTIEKASEFIWKGTLMGASSLGATSEAGSSRIFVNDVNGSQELIYYGNRTNVTPRVMQNGVIKNLDSVRLESWGRAGKISGDQDGIAYYYTNVDSSKNFEISADVKVNRYIEEPDKLDPATKTLYNRYIAEAIADGLDQEAAAKLALDKIRSGQEAFGIMARDAMPLAGGLDEAGEYTGSPTGYTTENPALASKMYYVFKDGLCIGGAPTVKEANDIKAAAGEGATVIETAATLFELYNTGYVVVDAAGEKYPISKDNINSEFTSNIVIAGGCTDGTFPTDVNSSSYYRKSIMNRINIMLRVGVDSPGAGGTRVGITSTTSSLPVAGDVYNITLKKHNTGFLITTHNYQTGETVTKYAFDEDNNSDGALTMLDRNNIYVGFFAARFADCTYSNIRLFETDPATDPEVFNKTEEAIAPKLTIASNYYTTDPSYTLLVKSNGNKELLGGIATISLNGEAIYRETRIGTTEGRFAFDLKRNTVNQFTIVYYPNTADNFTSYNPIVHRFTVTQKDLDDTMEIYVAPNGSINGDGSRSNPIDLETGLKFVEPGGKVIALDGTYNVRNKDLGKIELNSFDAGYARKPKTLIADAGANPVLDLEDKYQGIEINTDFWIIDGFTFTRSLGNTRALDVAGNHCIIRNCTFVANGTTAMQISRLGSSNLIEDWPSYNLIESCESYNNIDPSKNNADGFGAKLTVGFGNVFRDTISHHNIDDGWDCYTKISTGAIGSVVLEDCISYRQGYLLNDDGSESIVEGSSGGNGFKLGGENIYVKHYLKGCKTFDNASSGIDTNNNPALKARDVIAYRNGTNLSLYSKSGSGALVDENNSIRDKDGRVYKFDYDLKGMVSFGQKDSIGSWNSETQFGNIHDIDDPSNFLSADAAVSMNSEGEVLDPSTFFVSIDKSKSVNSMQRYKRNPDGSFDHGDFLKRTVPFEFDEEDIVTPPDTNGGQDRKSVV